MAPNKIVGLFGADLTTDNAQKFIDRLQKGYTLLVLDGKARALALQAGLPHVLVDEWFGAKQMRQAAHEALKIERLWYRSAEDFFTIKGIRWPLLDHQAMFWFWRDIVLAFQFIEAFLSAGGREVHFLTPWSGKPALFYDSSAPWKGIFELFFGAGEAGSMILTEDQRRYLSRYAAGLFSKLQAMPFDQRSEMLYADGLLPNPSGREGFHPEGDVVLAINPYEGERFLPVLKKMSSLFPGKVRVVFIFPHSLAARLMEESGIRVETLSAPVFADQKAAEQFEAGYKVLLEKTGDQFWHIPLTHLQNHFEYYFRERWPGLIISLDHWLQFWEKIQPRAVFTSQLIDAESQLPAEAANRLGIPTFSLPHGDYYLGDEAQPSQKMLYGFETHKQCLLRGGHRKDKVIGCQDVVLENEYRTRPSALFPLEKDRLKILVLSSMTTLEGVFMPLVSLKDQEEAFRSLKTPPPELDRLIFIRYKVHPNWPDLEVLKNAGIDLEKEVLPIDSDLHGLLDHFDLVIDLNFSSGSALIHALRKHKPILLYWPCGVNFSHWHEDLFSTAGPLIKDAPTLWQTIARFLNEADFAAGLKNQSAVFARKYLDPSALPGLKELLDDPDMDRVSPTPGVSSRREIIHLDADPDFYYGEIPREDLQWILEKNKGLNNIELVTHDYCNKKGNEYFREYALDPRRSLYLRLFGNLEKLKILDYGSGLGSIGFQAAKLGAEVIYVDSCRLRLEFALERNNNYGLHNNSFYACRHWRSLPFPDESFDLILLIGVVEWIPLSTGASYAEVLQTQLDFLKTMKGFLKKDGCIFLAMENRFALQYFFGYPEDHTEIPYLSLMPRKEANRVHLMKTGKEFTAWTWGYQDYVRLLPESGLVLSDGYALFPDYRFPRMISCLNDQRSLKRGMVMEKYEGSTEERRKHIDYLGEMALLHHFVYSYGLVLKEAICSTI